MDKPDRADEALKRVRRTKWQRAMGVLPHPADLPYSTQSAHIAAQDHRIADLESAIKRQAGAVKALHAYEETEINRLREQQRHWHEAVASLDGERETNARLTEEVERLTAERDAAIIALNEAATKRGEAEGNLMASEQHGVLEGWIKRAAEAERGEVAQVVAYAQSGAAFLEQSGHRQDAQAILRFAKAIEAGHHKDSAQ